MVASPLSFSAFSPSETDEIARRLAQRLVAGDVLLLQGDVGAGKTHFARALIQSVLLEPEDVPSPTFTLVQTYASSQGEIWHSDLYRISSTNELEELGLFEAFEAAICLIEWPDRLGAETPPDALTLNFQSTQEDDRRDISASWTAPKWDRKLEGWIA